MERLRATLREDCELGFSDRGAGVRPDSLRAWGPYRAEQIERAIASYEKTAGAFADAVGIKLEPK